MEIAALLPWLTATAFLHSIMVQQRRGVLKRWNVVLVLLTYELVIFAAFLTRSGLVSSVHTFAQSSIGPAFFVFMSGTVLVSVVLLLSRWSDLPGEEPLVSLFSRETLFLVNNLLFLSIIAACFWGVLFPLLSQVLTGQPVMVDPSYYQHATGPLFAGLLLLMAMAPLSVWGHTALKNLVRRMLGPLLLSLVVLVLLVGLGRQTNPEALLGFWLAGLAGFVILAEFWNAARARIRHGPLPSAQRNLAGRIRRRYGGYVIHLGVVLMALGVVGTQFYQQQAQGTLAPGQEIRLGPYRLRYDSIREWTTSDQRDVTSALVSVFQGNRQVAALGPRRDAYQAAQQVLTVPGILSTVQGDLYVILVGRGLTASSGATFLIYWNPLVNFLWSGAAVLILGTLLAAWPDQERGRDLAGAFH